ncbi:hypothetical protein DXT90_03325 [Agrobacterium tumefaciens]|nr:hypothetical protein [Agrobacterium tumefaciens]
MSSTAKYFVSPEGLYLGAWDGYRADDGSFVAPEYPANGIEVPSPPDDGRQLWKDGEWLPFRPPPPIAVIYPVNLWERMTKDEADAVGSAMAEQDFRTRKIFESASSYRSDHELWPLLQQIATTLFGETRAAQILAPSELLPVGTP